MQIRSKSKWQTLPLRKRHIPTLDVRRWTLDVDYLHTGNADLIQFIRARISETGPVSFAWFMEQALYHPAHGYYSSGRALIGREGDYFTNVSIGPLFGRLMAAQFSEMWKLLGEPAEFVIVEQGANDGQFAHDVLAAAAIHHPAFFAALRYCIVEPFALLHHRQEETLAAFRERVLWCDSLEGLEPFCGVHFSNELLDAMPVHLIRWSGNEWLERYVDYSGPGFVLFDQPIADAALSKRAARLPLPDLIGYETELNLAAAEWIGAVAQKLASGFVFTVDYGFSRDDFYAPQRTTGTLQSRTQHRAVRSPLEQIGEADITAHVEWTSIVEAAECGGLRFVGFTDQHHFITGLLSGADGARIVQEQNPKTQRALQTLLHPGLLGMKFQYLVLAKGVAATAALSGLRFARDGRATLLASS